MLVSDSLTMLVKQKHVPKHALQFTLPTPSHESIFHVSHWLEPVNSYEPSPSLFSSYVSFDQPERIRVLKRQH